MNKQQLKNIALILPELGLIASEFSLGIVGAVGAAYVVLPALGTSSTSTAHGNPMLAVGELLAWSLLGGYFTRLFLRRAFCNTCIDRKNSESTLDNEKN